MMEDHTPMTEEEIAKAEAATAYSILGGGTHWCTREFAAAARVGWPRALAEVRRLRNENQQLRTAIPFPGMRAKNLKRLEDDIAEIPLGREAFIELSLLVDHLIQLDKLLKRMK